MANKIASAALQYSKWLSRFICWIWAIYRFGVLIASAIKPDAAGALASTLINLDWIMLVNEGTYLINSLGEKYIYSDRFILAWLRKGGFNSLISKMANTGKEINSHLSHYVESENNSDSEDPTEETDDIDEEPEEDSEEGDGNG